MLAWLAFKNRFNQRLRRHFDVLLTLLPLKQINDLMGRHWYTFHAFDKARPA